MRKIDIVTGSIESVAEEAAEAIIEEVRDEIWDLKIKIFEECKKAEIFPLDAEGPDCEELLEEIMKAAWRKM